MEGLISTGQTHLVLILEHIFFVFFFFKEINLFFNIPIWCIQDFHFCFDVFYGLFKWFFFWSIIHIILMVCFFSFQVHIFGCLNWDVLSSYSEILFILTKKNSVALKSFLSSDNWVTSMVLLAIQHLRTFIFLTCKIFSFTKKYFC